MDVHLNVSSCSQFWLLLTCHFVLVQLPFKLHCFVSCAEWLLSYITSLRVEKAYQHLVPAPSRHGLHPVLHLLASVLLVLVLPGLGVWWLERSNNPGRTTAVNSSATAQEKQPSSTAPKCGCADTQQPEGDKAAATQSEGNVGKPAAQQHVKCSGGGSSDQVELSAISSLGAHEQCQQTTRSPAIRRGSQLMSDITGSLQLAAAAPRVVPYTSRLALPAVGGMHPDSPSSSIPALPDIMPSLRGLVGAESAAAVFAAAAAAATEVVTDRVLAVHQPMYHSISTKLPVGVKVSGTAQTAMFSVMPTQPRPQCSVSCPGMYTCGPSHASFLHQGSVLFSMAA